MHVKTSEKDTKYIPFPWFENCHSETHAIEEVSSVQPLPQTVDHLRPLLNIVRKQGLHVYPALLEIV